MEKASVPEASNAAAGPHSSINESGEHLPSPATNHLSGGRL